MKTPRDSAVTMTEIVLPSDTNALGTIFGGKVMAWIDIAAATAAIRHSRKVMVTASIDALHFIAPVKLGDILTIKASINYVGRTSCEIGVRVDSEDPTSGKISHTASAYLTFVALDKKGKPAVIPSLKVETPEEKRRCEAAKRRRAGRLALANDLKSSNLKR